MSDPAENRWVMMSWWDKDIIIQGKTSGDVTSQEADRITWFYAACLSQW